MSPAMKNNTIQQTTLSTKAKPKARVKLSLCKVEAFEAYWLKYVGDDSTPHDLNDIETFYDGFDLEDERMHMRCQMFRVKQLAKSIAKTTPFVLAHLEAKAQAQWLEALAREIATTTPKVLAHLDAKAKAQAKAKATKNPFDNFWKFPCKLNDKTPVCKWRDQGNQRKDLINPNRFNTGIPTGLRNNLLVVDLDVKDDGVEEFKKYIQEHGKPQTLHAIAPHRRRALLL